MPNTLLLCFIHGFKGSDDTFHGFPAHLQALLSESSAPDFSVETAVYPKYETRGDLPSCVEAFRAWLLQRVLTLEKEAGNTSPRLNPSVGIIIVAHSMGGLVATDAFLSILDEESGTRTKDSPPLFPLLQGIISFDTPYCGLSRSMFAYGAFAQYQNVTNAYGLVTALTSTSALTTAGSSVAEGPAWRAWQAVAMRTGAAGAIAAAGAAAYVNRDKIGQGLAYVNKEDISRGLSTALNIDNIKQTLSGVSRENIEQGLAYISRENIGQGMAWLSGHLQFVSALMKGEELQLRLERMSAMQGIGFANLYTSLGQNDLWSGGFFVAERTFCAIPAPKAKAHRYFIKEVNTKAKDETVAHMSMFRQDRNSGYDEMSAHTKGLLLSWAKNNSGAVLDPYRGRKGKGTASPPAFTRYTYSPVSGLKEAETGKAKDGWLTPTYATLSTYIPRTNYIPSIRSRSSSRERARGDSPSRQYAAGLSRYLWGDRAGLRDAAQTDKSTDSPGSSTPNTDEAAAESEAQAPTEEQKQQDIRRADERAGELLQFTGQFPGVTEDLKFEEGPAEGLEVQPADEAGVNIAAVSSGIDGLGRTSYASSSNETAANPEDITSATSAQSLEGTESKLAVTNQLDTAEDHADVVEHGIRPTNFRGSEDSVSAAQETRPQVIKPTLEAVDLDLETKAPRNTAKNENELP